MKRSLSIAKITRPTLPKVFPRERLFKLLEEGRERSVIWISGPAGSGKTTLVASYIETRRLPCLWYQVDEGDSDIATFFYYLGLAGKKAAPRHRKPLPLLTAEYLPDVPTFSKRYFENLCSRLQTPFFLVLDNYQLIPASSPFHEILQAGLLSVPHGIHIVIISRAEPPAGFTRLLAGNALNVIGWDDLRLTPDESEGIALLLSKVPQHKDLIPWMHEKTDGWAAGLILFIKALGREAVEPQTLPTMPPEKIFEYFANELFDKIDGETRDFLLKTSILPKITPSIAEQLTGNTQSARILSELNRRNYFTEKRRLEGSAYQYHPLFREFLQSRASKTFSEGEIAAVRRSAAQMIEASGQVDDAVELYRQSRDWQGMARLILQNAQALALQGRNETLERWILGLPEEMCKSAPWLLYWHGISRLAPHPSEARQHFSEAFELFKQQGDRAGLLLSWTGAVDTYLLEWNDVASLKLWIRELKEYMKAKTPFPSRDIEIAVTARMFNALFFVQPQDRDLPAWEKKMLSYLEYIEDRDQRMMLSAHLLFYYSWTGELDKMNKQIRNFDIGTGTKVASPIARVLWLLHTAVYAWFRAEYAESLRLVQKALELTERLGMHIIDPRVMAQGVFASLTAGDFKVAENYLGKMKEALNPEQKIDVGQYHWVSAYYFAAIGDLASAYSHAVRAVSMWGKTGVPFAVAVGNACLAHINILRKKLREAAVCIGRACAENRKMHSLNVEMQVHMLQAQIAYAQGNERRMVSALRKGIVIGREQGFMGISWWLPAAMEPLCTKAIEYGIETEYVRELIQKRNFVPDKPVYHLENWPWPVKIYTLGRFSILENGKPLRFSAKGQKKPLDMLKAVIVMGGRDVSDQQITDALWPDAEGDAGRMLFKTTLHRLRQLMGNNKAITVQEGRLTLDNRLCWVDAWAFERFLGEADRLWVSGKGRKESGLKKDKTAEAVKLTEKALALYQGLFLEADTKESWIVPHREHLRIRYIRAVGKLAYHWEQARQYEKAADCYQSALRVDDLTEEFYQRLMICYMKLGRKAEAIKTYRRCCAALKTGMGVEPSIETTAIYRTITQ